MLETVASVERQIGDVLVRMTHGDETIVSAAVPDVSPFRLEVARGHSYLGAEDVRTGDPEFDNVFMVRSSSPELARRWLHEPLRNLMYLTRFAYVLAGQAVRATGHFNDTRELGYACEAVAGLATRRVGIGREQRARLLEARAQAGHERDVEDEGSGRDVTIDLFVEQGSGQQLRTFTRLETMRRDGGNDPFAIHRVQSEESPPPGLSPLPIDDEDFGARYLAYGADSAQVRRRLGDSLRTMLVEAEPTRIVCDGTRLTLLAEGDVDQLTRLDRLDQLITRLAVGDVWTGRSGPYR